MPIPKVDMLVPAQAVPAFRWVHEIPSFNPMMGLTFECIGYENWGYEIQILDPLGSRAFHYYLLADGAPDDAFPDLDDLFPETQP
jgi:hypothetical protein